MMMHKQRLNHYLAPTLFAAAAALFIITGVEYLKVAPNDSPARQGGVSSFSTLSSMYAKTVDRIELKLKRVSGALGIGPEKIEPAKLSRMAVIRHRGEAYQILGIKAGTALSERRVVVRDMRNNRIGEFAAGQRIFGGAKIENITSGTVQVVVEAPQRRLIQLNTGSDAGRIL